MTESTNLDESEDALAFRYLQRQFDYPKDIVKKKKKTVSDEVIEAIEAWLHDYYERKLQRELANQWKK